MGQDQEQIEDRMASKSGELVVQVNYVYEDNAVPSWENLSNDFVASVLSKFSFSEGPEQFDARLKLIQQLQTMDVKDRSAITQLRTIKFQRGAYKAEDGAIYSISDVSLSHDRIYCMLEGTTAVAEKIVEELGEMACNSAGRSWEALQSKQLFSHYGTASSERLGATGLELLSPAMRRFAKEVLGSPAIASAMNPRLVGAEPVDSSRYNVVVHPYDLQIKVRVANMNTNDVDAHDVRLTIRKIPDHDAGVYLLQTQLPSDQHQEVVEKLREILVNPNG